MREESPSFYTISSKRRGFVRAQGGRGKQNKIYLCLSTIRFEGLVPNSVEATEFQVATKHGEKAPPASPRVCPRCTGFVFPGNRSVRRGFKPPRAPPVRVSPYRDFAQNTFELRLIHIAILKKYCSRHINR